MILDQLALCIAARHRRLDRRPGRGARFLGLSMVTLADAPRPIDRELSRRMARRFQAARRLTAARRAAAGHALPQRRIW